jgi:hypothetical protein
MLRFALFTLFLVASAACSAASSVFVVPGEEWGFQFESSPVKSHRGAFGDGEYQLEVLSSGGLIATVFVEAAQGKGATPEECRSFYWGLSSVNPAIVAESVKTEVAGEFEVVSYTVEAEQGGVLYVQPNINFYGYREGKCIDVHISQAFPEGVQVDYANLELFRNSLKYFIQK